MEEVPFEFGLKEKVGSGRQRREATALISPIKQRKGPVHTGMRSRMVDI